MGKFDPEMGSGVVWQQKQLATVGCNVLLHDGQADTRATGGVGGLDGPPVKRLEDTVAVGFSHTGALVVYGDVHQRAGLRQLQPDGAARG